MSVTAEFAGEQLGNAFSMGSQSVTRGMCSAAETRLRELEAPLETTAMAYLSVHNLGGAGS